MVIGETLGSEGNLESVKKENTYVNNYFKAIVTLLGDVLKGCSKWFEEAKKKKSESK